MALGVRMNKDQMNYFIENEFLPQVETEIGNWIHPGKKQGGYFVVTRQIMCFIDFLGAVYMGYPRKERLKDERENRERIATTKKAKQFIIDFFEPKTTYTDDVVSNLYSIYRHGLIHLYQPRVLKYNSRKALQWYFYRGKKRIYKTQTVDTPKGKMTFNNVRHLQILKEPNAKHYFFPIGIDCLYEDFVNAVEKYRVKLNKTKSLQSNWRTAVNAICKPHPA